MFTDFLTKKLFSCLLFHIDQISNVYFSDKRFLFCELGSLCSVDAVGCLLISVTYVTSQNVHSDGLAVQDTRSKISEWLGYLYLFFSHQGRSQSRLMTPIKRARLASFPRYLPPHSSPSNTTISYKHTNKQKAIGGVCFRL